MRDQFRDLQGRESIISLPLFPLPPSLPSSTTYVHKALQGNVAGAVLLDTGEQVEGVIDGEVFKGGHLGFVVHNVNDLMRLLLLLVLVRASL